MTNLRWTHAVVPYALGLFLIGAGCNRVLPTGPSGHATYDVGAFIQGVQTFDGSQGNALPALVADPSVDGPVVTLTANTRVIKGGSNLARVHSTTMFQAVDIFVGGVDAGVSGYWEVHLSSPATDVTLVITFSQNIPTTSFDLVAAAASPGGTRGPYFPTATTVLPAGTGNVQVSVSWDALSDVDLHVVDPHSEEIYYAHTSAASGGALDLDSNPACAFDRTNNENIRWPLTTAPSGTYIVRVDYFSSCGVPSTNYVVTVNNGTVTTVFRGTLTGNGDLGGNGSGRLITTFTHAGATPAGAQPSDLLFGVLPVPAAPPNTHKVPGQSGE
jgi:hypothetical protein